MRTDQSFPRINRAYNSVFKPNRLSLGLVVPVESYAVGAEPTMHRHIERVQLAEELGFAAVWLRDVPFNVPSFGDAGQLFDPFVYLGALALTTRSIALGVASVVLPLRHPAHVAKAAASADVLSGGRVLLGVASGDRPAEYPALGRPFDDRGTSFRESVDFIRAMASSYPKFSNSFGMLEGGVDMLPKPSGGRVPLLITGGSQQSPDWVARHGDGWMTYPRDVASQGRVVAQYRERLSTFDRPNQPVVQSLYIDLVDDPAAPIRPIHLGFSSGVSALLAYLRNLREQGVNHVALNLRFNSANPETTLRRIAADLLPEFTEEAPANV